MLFPGFAQAGLAQVHRRLQRPQQGTEAIGTVLAKVEAAVAGNAMEEMIAADMVKFRVDQFVFAVVKRDKAGIVGPFQADDLLRG